MQTTTFEKASWVAERTFGTAKVEVSSKGAIALNGNRFKPQRYEDIADLVKPEVRAWLESDEVVQYIAGSRERMALAKARSEKLAKLVAAGFTLDEAQAMVKAIK